MSSCRGMAVCGLMGIHERTMADAHLIAAAPELYEACRKALHELEVRHEIEEYNQQCEIQPSSAMVLCRTALQKARGEADG